MKNCKIYVGGQEVGQLQDFNCDISAPEDYHAPYDSEKMETITLPFLHILPKRMTYYKCSERKPTNQYCKS